MRRLDLLGLGLGLDRDMVAVGLGVAEHVVVGAGLLLVACLADGRLSAFRGIARAARVVKVDLAVRGGASGLDVLREEVGHLLVGLEQRLDEHLGNVLVPIVVERRRETYVPDASRATWRDGQSSATRPQRVRSEELERVREIPMRWTYSSMPPWVVNGRS